MHDDSRPGIDAVDDIVGMTPGPFTRLFIAGEDGSEARRDAAALGAALAERAQPITVAERADLIVTGSARDGLPGRVALDPGDRALLEGRVCPVAIAPRGLAERDDHELRRIDIGIDGGRGAATALDLAVRLAIAHDARLRLVAVARFGFEPGGAARQTDPCELERLTRRLERAADNLAGIEVETELREGLPDQILLGLAREADLLVLGSRATYGNAGRVVFGDVAARILRAAPCPTLVAPAD